MRRIGLTNGSWHHIVATYDGNVTLTFFYDGASLGTATLVGPLNTILSSSGLTIGKDFFQSLHFYNGTIDEVATYDRALTATEVANHYQGGSGL